LLKPRKLIPLVVNRIIRMVEIDPTQVGIQAGGGGIAGFALGYAAKKIVKFVLLIGGVTIGILAYLDHQGIIPVPWELVTAVSISPGEAATQAQALVDAFVGVVPLGGGFAVGTTIGFKRG
jgi:Uncharacterized conserved protein